MGNNQSKLSQGLTDEEFMKLADRQPNLEGDWIYRLEQTELGNGPHNYPAFKVGATHYTDFSSHEDAQKYMLDQSIKTPMYRSRITQIPIGGTENERGAQWLYDSDGSLVDYTVVAKAGSAEETSFFGRDKDAQRFFPLDIAEILDGDEVKLVVIIGPVATPSDLWEEYLDDESEYSFGYEFDSYIILKDESGELSRGLVTALMEPRFERSPEVREILDRRMKVWFDDATSGDNPNVKIVPIIDDDDELDPSDDDNCDTIEDL